MTRRLRTHLAGSIRATTRPLIRDLTNSITPRYVSPREEEEDPESLHAWLIKSGHGRDRFLANALVDGYAKVDQLGDARKVFDEMPEKNTVSWTCLISGYGQRGFSTHACGLLGRMVSSGLVPTQYAFGSVLRACRGSGRGLFGVGLQVHCMALKMGYGLEDFVCNALITMYGSCSYDPVNDAFNAFRDAPKGNAVSWNSLISTCSRHGDVVSILELFSAMQRGRSSPGLRPNEYTFGSVITATNFCSSPSRVLVQVLAGVVKGGFLSNLYVGSALVSALARAGLVDKAKDVFQGMPNTNAASLNGLMVGLVRLKHGEEAVECFKEASCSLEINDDCYVAVLGACAEFESPSEGRRKGKEIHGFVVRIGLDYSSVAIGNGLVNMYAKCGSIDDAYSVFRLMDVKDQVSWSSIIAGFDHNGCCEEALLIFHDMRRYGVVPSNFGIISSLSSSAYLGILKVGLQLHSDVVKLGLDLDASVCNSLLTMYTECGGISDCRKVFNYMPQHDLVSWNCMIRALAGIEAPTSEVVDVLVDMMRREWHPNQITFMNVLSALSQLSAIELACQLHSLIVKYGYAEDRSLENALISCYAHCGEMRACESIFHHMSKRRDDVSWNSMLSGYIQNEHFAKAMDCIWLMMHRGPKIDCFAISIVLSACASIAALEHGKEIHAFGVRSLLGSDIVVASSLVDMYSKCGRVDYAHHIFSSMPFKNEFSWNSMISGYARHGHAMKALDLFKEMQQEEIRPDHITYVGILSACSHVGLVKEGLDYFESMRTKHGLVPQMEHYSCVVDLLGRAGKLNEMENFIRSMPINPNTLVWRTVLGACCRVKSSYSIDLGRQAGKMLLELEPSNLVNYVLLCHLYASKGRWEDVAKTRASMHWMPNKKEAGCSWVTLKDGLHAFVSGDKSHPQIETIYVKLHELNKKIRDAGYIPRTDFALYDLEEENKEELLSYHSERLAVAFVLTRPSELPIRIMKNLRVCGDCHSALTYISKVIGRQITLRDSNRFHHFDEGNCSCGGYW